jgi:hypothetical protein
MEEPHWSREAKSWHETRRYGAGPHFDRELDFNPALEFLHFSESKRMIFEEEDLFGFVFFALYQRTTLVVP